MIHVSGRCDGLVVIACEQAQRERGGRLGREERRGRGTGEERGIRACKHPLEKIVPPPGNWSRSK